MKTIELKKSELAMFKGLGKSVEQMAILKHCSTKDIREALAFFGLSKGKPKEYQLLFVDDTAETAETVTNTPEVVA